MSYIVMKESDCIEKFQIKNDMGETSDDFQAYLKYLTVSGKSPNTVRNYAYHLCSYLNYCESVGVSYKNVYEVEDFKPVDHMINFMLWLQYPDYKAGILHMDKEKPARSNKTVNIIVGTVLSFYDYLASNQQISGLNFYTFRRGNVPYQTFLTEMFHHNLSYKKSLLKKPEESKMIEAATRKQYEELLKHCTLRRDKVMIALMFEGGLRLGEVLGLHMEDLTRLEEGVVKITPRENNENGARVKNYAAGVIKLPDYVTEALVSYIMEDICDYDSDFVFLNLTGKNKGMPIKPDTIEKLFDRLSREVGFEIHPHMLRHGFATEKLNSGGWQMEEVQAYLRHKNIMSTQIYAQYMEETKKEMMRNYIEQNQEELRKIADEIL